MTDALLKTLLGRETSVWEALVRGDAKADAQALDDGFLGVYPDGFSGKSAHVSQLANGPTVAVYALDEARVLALGEGDALLAYRATYRKTGCDAPEVMYVSSIWRQGRDGWRNIFSQDTPASADWAGP